MLNTSLRQTAIFSKESVGYAAETLLYGKVCVYANLIPTNFLPSFHGWRPFEDGNLI